MPIRPCRVAIIGSGPGGCFTAEALLKSNQSFVIDIIEQLPFPFGLIRYGVAPDHQHTKKVGDRFNDMLAAKSVGYIGNVKVGGELEVRELIQYYDLLVFANGGRESNPLEIPGSQLPGCYSASDFIAWINGHPHYCHSDFNLSHETAIIIGNGNVALDAARLLAKTPDALRLTDIPEKVLHVLTRSRIKTIYIIGRRGPAQTGFSTKELRELSEVADCELEVVPDDMILNAASQTELTVRENYRHQQNHTFLSTVSQSQITGKKNRRIILRFLRQPQAITGVERVNSIVLEKNILSGDPGQQRATGTGELEELPCGMIFAAIGQHGAPIANVPFANDLGIIPNDCGRVLKNDIPIPGWYVSGWSKTGAKGLIGTNKRESLLTVESILSDLAAIPACAIPDSAALVQSLRNRGITVIQAEDWLAIDKAERERGSKLGKPREKFCSVGEIQF